METANIALTFLIAAAGSWLGLKSRLPAGALMGAIFSVGLFQILTGMAAFPQEIRVVTTSATGAFLGGRVNRRDIRTLRSVCLPAVLMTAGMLGYNMVCAQVLYRLAGLDFMTALLACAPGGLTEMTLVAIDLQANSALVSSIQIIRFAAVTLCVPVLLRAVLARRGRGGRVEEDAPAPDEAAPGQDGKHILLTLSIGLLSGLLGKLSGIPAGTLCFSVAACAAYNLCSGRGELPRKVRTVVQCGNGALIGTKLMAGQLLLLQSILPPVAAVTAGWIGLNVLLGLLLHRTGRLSLETALFAAAPGGMGDMGLIAAEMGGNSVQVMALQLCRVISVIAVCPHLAVMFG